MLGISLALCFTGCNNSQNSVIETSVSNPDSSLINSQSNEALTVSSLPTNQGGFIYNDVTIRNDESTGSPKSYSELVDFLEPYADNMNFVRFSIEKQYSPDKAAGLIGEELSKVSTLFDAHIDYDYLNNTEVDMNILLVQAGNAESQYANCHYMVSVMFTQPFCLVLILILGMLRVQNSFLLYLLILTVTISMRRKLFLLMK